ncbi:hypothetical protein [Pseudoalteromonas luteoviolacea]|uniref:hypothetical protein n=1 Tax=Pseudoalteromonas luteoviolacea TaxID=43657 RepID=UPI00114DE670|nr:hypothetical protein [Pseudoalteromonas luteoviolacea]TQF70745.1 hypothetical protein FLM44_06560 [Pseudoalteromonas luteoviolacea]
MDNNEFEQLSSLWQSSEDKSLPHMEKLLKRHKRQSFILQLNILIELSAILAVSYLLLLSFLENMPLIKQAWIGFATLWGISLFILMSKSRLSSLKHLKSAQLSTSLEAHIKLIKNEIFRWELSIKATWIFAVAFGAFIGSECYFSTCANNDLLHIGLSFIVLLVAQVFFVRKGKTAQKVLRTLTD